MHPVARHSSASAKLANHARNAGVPCVLHRWCNRLRWWCRRKQWWRWWHQQSRHYCGNLHRDHNWHFRLNHKHGNDHPHGTVVSSCQCGRTLFGEVRPRRLSVAANPYIRQLSSAIILGSLEGKRDWFRRVAKSAHLSPSFSAFRIVESSRPTTFTFRTILAAPVCLIPH